MTKAEIILWSKLKGKQLGYKFRRQHGIGKFIVDFYCPVLKMIIEVDGDVHGFDNQIIKDRSRQTFLESLGFTICRYTNNDVIKNIGGVLDDLVAKIELILLSSTTPSPSSSEEGRFKKKNHTFLNQNNIQMSTYKTEGIIIKRNNFLEASLILDIYTRDYGKVEAVARSARKVKGKLKGHLELFLDTELILAHGKNIDTITSSLTVESFSDLRDNLEISYGAYYIMELVDKMTAEKHKDERVFYLLKKALLFLDELAGVKLSLRGSRNDSRFLERDKLRNPVTMHGKLSHGIASSLCGASRNDINILILFFQTNLLNLTGFSPELNKCVFCEKPINSGKNYFNFSMGGVVGSKCGLQKGSTALKGQWSQRENPKAILIDDNTIKLLRLFQFKGNSSKEYNSHLNKCFEIIKKLKIDEKLVLRSVFLMNKFIEFNVERKIKGVDFLR